MSSREIFLILGLVLILAYYLLDRFKKIPEAISWLLLGAAVICLAIGLIMSCGGG